MKKILTVLAVIVVLPVFAKAQAPVTFKTITHSFGKIPQGKPVTTNFVFTNTSDKPLVIEVATAGCGCTTPEYPKTPILKGKSGTIKVTYNAASEGEFKKDVTVKFANIAEPVILTIDGEVVKSK